MSFIHDDFLLSNDAAVRLYHDYAAQQPIIDYHNHLSPKDIALNRRFENLFEMWVNHDHYKWRAMRANGISEHLITGDGSPKEKFLAFAATVPYTVRNPIYHWTHLELKRFFDIDELLCESNAEAIWNECNHQIESRDELTTQGILKKFNVTALCTTDDPVDSLEYHQQVAQTDFQTKVYPAFRPDWALFVREPGMTSFTRLVVDSQIMAVNRCPLISAMPQRLERSLMPPKLGHLPPPSSTNSTRLSC